MDNYTSIQKRMARFQSYGQSLPSAKVYFREDWQSIYFDLLGKQFGIMTPTADEQTKITLKNRPELNEELREVYPDVVIPGYYANKKHWNSIMLNSSDVTDEMIEKLIYQSYTLVKQNMTKKEQALIEEE